MDKLILNSNTIPAWVVAAVMLYSGIIWLISRGRTVRMDSRIIGYTLLVEGLIYGVLYQFTNVGVEVRGFFARLMLMLLCLSQSLPLTVSYIRSFKREHKG